MLFDSVGMQPVPNNGTLRLPLSPAGLHDAESTLEELADPEPEETKLEIYRLNRFADYEPIPSDS